MANTSLALVQFHGASLFTILVNGVPFVALRQICEAIGLDWQAQHARIMRHPVLSTCVSVTKTQMPGDDQAREVFMLPLDKLNGWLFGVQVGRVKPELRDRLTQYQAECFDVLAGHFGAMPQLSGNAAQLPPTRAMLVNTAPTTKHHSAQQCEAAVQAGGLASFQVQMALARAVLDGGDDWQHQRWLISFAADSERGEPPLVQRLAADTLIVAPSDLPPLLLQTGSPFTPGEVAQIAQYANMRMLKEVCNVQIDNEAERMKKQVRTLHTTDLTEVAKQAWLELSMRATKTPKE